MKNSLVGKILADKWRLATYLVPVLFFVAFAHYTILPLAGHWYDIQNQLSELKENIYEKAWLDSTEFRVKQEVHLLKGFQKSRESALASDNGVQATIDRIRGLAQKNGIEITKTTPILARAEPLRRLKIKLEGYAPYSSMVNFFDTLSHNHPDLYLEEMLIRKGGERSLGRLDCQFVLHVHDRKLGAVP